MSTMLYDQFATRVKQVMPYNRPVPMGADKIKSDTPYGQSPIALGAIRNQIKEQSEHVTRMDSIESVMAEQWRPKVTRVVQPAKTVQGRFMPLFQYRQNND
jgi:hypothetical protein